MTTVLLTSFEPNDNGINASEVVVRALQRQLPLDLSEQGMKLHIQVLPGDTNKLEMVVKEILSGLRPDVCIGIGQARGYNKIAVERMAKNLRYFVTPDRAGNAPKTLPAVEGGAIAYWHSLRNIEGVVQSLESNGIPTRIMNDCGTHLCNQAFYHFLHWNKNHLPSTRVGFVHIPALPEQVIKQWPEAPFMSLEMTCRAISLIIRTQL